MFSNDNHNPIKQAVNIFTECVKDFLGLWG